MKSKKYFFLNEIDKLKFYFFFIICVCISIFFFLAKSKQQSFQSKVTINSAYEASIIYSYVNGFNYLGHYKNFLLKLSSINNFYKFLVDKNYDKPLNEYLKKKSLEEYLEKNFYLVHNNTQLIILNEKTIPILYFIYPSNVHGGNILNEYVKETYNKNLDLEINNFKKNLMSEIQFKKDLIFFIENIKLETNSQDELEIQRVKKEIFILEHELKKIEYLIKQTKYDPILDHTINLKMLIYPNMTLFIFYGVLTGILLSFLILILRIFWLK